MDAKQFLFRFHNLDGVTVAEKQKSFNKLLKESKQLLQNPNTSKDIIANLQSTTYLESLFRVDVLLAAQNLPELVGILKSENEILICRIIKNEWFITEAFRNMTAPQIIEEFFPYLSFSVRTKLVKKLSVVFNNKEMVDHLFDCYKEKYGLSASLPLLFGCSNDKIESIIKSNELTLTSSHVVRLLRKAPQLLPLYIEKHIKHVGHCNYLLKDCDFMKFVASNFFDIYKVLEKRYKITIRHSKRTTKKIFGREKDKILADPGSYKNSLESGIFVRNLGKHGQFKQYFKSVFPKCAEDFFYNRYEMNFLLEKCPKNRRYQLLKETFEEVYNIRLIDCPRKISKKVLDLMCCEDDAEERNQAAKKLLELTNDVSYVAYQRPADSIPYLKREINLSSNVNRRKRLIELLVTTCKINNDMDSFVSVVQYVIGRHSNDCEVVCSFLACIEHNFDMHKFTQKLWTPVLELLETYVLKRPENDNFPVFLLIYAEFKYSLGEPFKEYILKFSSRDLYGDYLFCHHCKNLKFLQTAIREFVIFFLQNDEGRSDFDYYRLFEYLFKWNAAHPEYQVSYLDYPKLLDVVRKTMKELYHPFFICSKDRNEFVEELSDLYWKFHSKDAKTKEIIYFFKWYPLVMLKYKELIINSLLCKGGKLEHILRWIQRYEHLQFPQYVVQFNQQKFSENKSEPKPEIKFKRLFTMLIRFMDPQDFINYVSEYKPKDLFLNNWTNDEKKMYQLEVSIARSFKYTVYPTKMFPLLISYCGGDFLKSVLDSLYKYFHNSRNNILQPYLDQLAKDAVSVRKHSVFLTLRISDVESSKNILKHFITTEKNTSLQKCFMLTALRSFFKNPSSGFWDLFVLSLDSVKDNDKETFEMLVSPKNYIPKYYIPLYYQTIWDVIERKNLNKSFKYTLQNCFAKKTETFIEDFPMQFCCIVIDTLFFKFPNEFSYSSDVNTFVFEFMLHFGESYRFTKIINLLQCAKNIPTDDIKLQRNVRKEICYFIDRFCDFYIDNGESKKWDKTLLPTFMNQLINLYPAVEVFPEFLTLSLTLKLTVSCNIKDYAHEVSLLVDELTQKFSVYIVENLQSSVITTLKFFERDYGFKNVTVEFIKAFLTVKTTEVNEVLCLLILLDSDHSEPGFEDCVNIFKQSKCPYIQIILRQREII